MKFVEYCNINSVNCRNNRYLFSYIILLIIRHRNKSPMIQLLSFILDDQGFQLYIYGSYQLLLKFNYTHRLSHTSRAVARRTVDLSLTVIGKQKKTAKMSYTVCTGSLFYKMTIRNTRARHLAIFVC